MNKAELDRLFAEPMTADQELDLSAVTDVMEAGYALEARLDEMAASGAGSLRLILAPAGPEDAGLFMPMAQHIRLLKRAGRIVRALPLAESGVVGFHIIRGA